MRRDPVCHFRRFVRSCCIEIKFHTQPAKHWFFGRKFVVLSAGKCVFFLFRDAFFPEEKDDDERL
jgi:hypothetical protein